MRDEGVREARGAMHPDHVREARIDLGALAHNLRLLRSLGGEREVIAVVKADAYGHGAVAAARALLAAGARRLAVVTTEEAMELREADIAAPILVLGGAPTPAAARAAARHHLIPVVQHESQIEGLARVASPDAALCVELEVDSAMSRQGLAPGDAPAALERLAAVPGIRVDGLYTHMARADEEDLEPTREQLRRFAGVVAEARQRGVLPGRVHVANSAGVLATRALAADLPPEVNAIRPGLSLYGVRPAPHLAADLLPVMTLRARVVNLRRVEAGAAVGYGGTWRAAGPTRIATLALGYADGVPWSLAGRGEVALHGRRLPIVGRISMDSVTVDVGGLPAAVGDVATFFGAGGPPVEEVAVRAGTLAYELLVRVGRRVPRVAASPTV